MNVIQVHGIRTYSYHGCLKEETKIGGNYIVNIDINCDFKNAAQNDDLSQTIDYVNIKDIVIKEMGIPAKLIETKAYQIIEKIKASFENIEKCKVEIKKINPPINGDVSHVSVIVEE